MGGQNHIHIFNSNLTYANFTKKIQFSFLYYQFITDKSESQERKETINFI